MLEPFNPVDSDALPPFVPDAAGTAPSVGAGTSPDLPATWRWQRAPRLCALFAALVAVIVLTGWAFHVPALVTILPTLPAMAQSTATAFLLASFSLWLKQSEGLLHNDARTQKPHFSAKRHGFGQAFALAALLTGLFTLLRFGLLILQHRSLPTGGAAHPLNVMSPNSAVNFVLLGSALLLLDVHEKSNRRPAQVLAFIVLLNALVALVGQLYGVTFLYGLSAFLGMAIHTVLLFLVLSIGLLLARPERGFVAILLADNAAGQAGRRFLPLALVAPIILGGVGVLSQKIEHLDGPFLSYALVILSVGCLG